MTEHSDSRACRPPDDAQPPLRLADGVVFVVSPVHQRLRNLEQDTAFRLEREHLAPIDALLRGLSHPPPGSETLFAELQAHGFVDRGPAGEDPVLRRRLLGMDEQLAACPEGPRSAAAQGAHAAIISAHARRKRVDGRYGQLTVCPETALRRATMLGEAAPGRPLHIVCLGDDDMMSVGLAALGHRVTVLEVDPHVLDCIAQTCAAQSMHVTLHEQDIRQPLEPALHGQFDVFLADPMSNPRCLELFIARGVALTGAGKRGYVASAPPMSSTVDVLAQRMGCSVAQRRRRFNRYYSADYRLHEYESDWTLLRLCEGAAPTQSAETAFAPDKLYDEDVYARPALLQLEVHDIEDAHLAVPLHLDLLLDVLAQASGRDLQERHVATGRDWTVVHCFTEDGYWTLRVDRPRRSLCVLMFPHDRNLASRLFALLSAAFKPVHQVAEGHSTAAAYHVRVR